MQLTSSVAFVVILSQSACGLVCLFIFTPLEGGAVFLGQNATYFICLTIKIQNQIANKSLSVHRSQSAIFFLMTG